MNLYLGPHCVLLIYMSIWGAIALQYDLRSSMLKPPVLILFFFFSLSVVVAVVSLTEPRITWEDGL